VPYLSASAVVIHYEEALYQVIKCMHLFTFISHLPSAYNNEKGPYESCYLYAQGAKSIVVVGNVVQS